LGLVERVIKGQAARPGWGSPILPGGWELGLGASRECRRLFVPDLYEFNTVLAGSQGFKQSVDTIAGIAKDRVDTPGDQSLDERIGYRLSHGFSPFSRALGALPVCPAGSGLRRYGAICILSQRSRG